MASIHKDILIDAQMDQGALAMQKALGRNAA